MGNIDSIFDLDACVTRERAEPKAAPRAPKPRAPEPAPDNELTARQLRVRAPPRLELLRRDGAADDEEASPSERLRRMAFRTPKDDFLDQVRGRKGELARQRQLDGRAYTPKTSPSKVASGQPTGYKGSVGLPSNEVEFTIGDMCGPNVMIEVDRARAKREDHVRQRMAGTESPVRQPRAGAPPKSPASAKGHGSMWMVQ